MRPNRARSCGQASASSQAPQRLSSRLRSLLLVSTAGLAVLATTALSAIGGSHLHSALGPLLRVGVLAASLQIDGE
jgi:hypothetical protein